MKVVAISGWKRSGKDTVAGQLVVDNGFKRVAFADPLKNMVAQEYDIPREHCDDPAFKEAPILHLPLSPKDTFSLGIAKMLFKECRTEDGKTPVAFTVDPSGVFLGVTAFGGVFVEREVTAQLYWTPRALCILKGSINRTVRSDFWVQAAINDVKGSAKFGNSQKFVISDLRYKSEVNQLRQAFGKDLITIRVNRFDTCNSDDASERDLDNGTFDVVIENRGSLEDLQAAVNKILKEKVNV